MVPVLVCALFFALFPPYGLADGDFDVADRSPPAMSFEPEAASCTSGSATLVFVQAPRPTMDFELDDIAADRLERKLLTDPVLAPHAETVTVDVVDGRVTLRGMIDPRWRSAVIRTAAETLGTSSIRDSMQTTYDP